jgi:hypothetical protein
MPKYLGLIRANLEQQSSPKYGANQKEELHAGQYVERNYTLAGDMMNEGSDEFGKKRARGVERSWRERSGCPREALTSTLLRGGDGRRQREEIKEGIAP